VSDTHGRDGGHQQIWHDARTKLVELLLDINKELPLLKPRKGSRLLASSQKKIDDWIVEINAVMPIFAKFRDDVNCKNLVARWPEVNKYWLSMQEAQRTKFNEPTYPEYVEFNSVQLAGKVAIIAGYATTLPHDPPGS
jgi:hypothetical protein